MAYATTAQVSEELRGVSLSATTDPTDTVVTRWISEAEAEINAIVGKRYQVPIDSGDSPKDYLFMQNLCIMIVAARLRRYLGIKSPFNEVNQHIQTDTDDKARKILAKIASGDYKLQDATIVSDSVGVSSFNVSSSQEFIYKKGVDQW